MRDLLFRAGTVDQDCWNGIVNGNEYELPRSLDPQKWVVDIGTHVGSFVKAAWDRGARRIASFEASEDNMNVAINNVGFLEGEITLRHMAVGRSDDRATDRLHFSGFVPFFDGRTNTGGGDVFSEDGETVRCIRFDDICKDEEIQLLKIDCEGSEWPILYTAKSLHRVQSIVGEYHSILPHVEEELDLMRPCSREGLIEFLVDAGFNIVEVQPHSEMHAQYHNGQKIGLFRATR